MRHDAPLTSLHQLNGMPAAEFVLHREPMLLLDTLVASGDHGTTCEWHVGEDHSFLESKLGVPAYVGVEFMAQCVAVHAGARARIAGLRPPLGFLLGARHFKSSVSHFSIGGTYRVTCQELIRDDYGMGSYECYISHGELRIAEARLAILEKVRGQKLDE